MAGAEDKGRDSDKDTESGLEVVFAARGFDSLTPNIWLFAGGLPEVAARSDGFRDVIEVTLVPGDVLRGAFFSIDRPFPTLPPG